MLESLGLTISGLIFLLVVLHKIELFPFWKQLPLFSVLLHNIRKMLGNIRDFNFK